MYVRGLRVGKGIPKFESSLQHRMYIIYIYIALLPRNPDLTILKSWVNKPVRKRNLDVWISWMRSPLNVSLFFSRNPDGKTKNNVKLPGHIKDRKLQRFHQFYKDIQQVLFTTLLLIGAKPMHYLNSLHLCMINSNNK